LSVEVGHETTTIKVVIPFSVLEQISRIDYATNKLKYDKAVPFLIGKHWFTYFILGFNTLKSNYLKPNQQNKNRFLQTISKNSSLPIRKIKSEDALELCLDVKAADAGNFELFNSNTSLFNEFVKFSGKRLNFPLRSLKKVYAFKNYSKDGFLLFRFEIKGTDEDIYVFVQDEKSYGSQERFGMLGGGCLRVGCAITLYDILDFMSNEEIVSLAEGIADVFSGYYQLIQKYRQNLSSKEEVW
jgi:hypothetical protein